MVGVNKKMSEKISNIKVMAWAAIVIISSCVAASPIFCATNAMMGIIIAPKVLNGFIKGAK